MSSDYTATRGCKPFKCLLFLFLIVASGSGLDINGARFTRSPNPGLFGGLPSPSDLASNLKPITLADLNALKDKIKGFDGLSSTVEKVVAAGKETQNGLQTFIETMQEKISSLENALNPDENNFWGQSESCGGVVVAQTGRISYKPNSDYTDYERCVWTIRVNYRSKVKVQLTGRGSGSSSMKENGFDSVRVSSFETLSSLHTVELVVGQKYIFKGPILIVSFISDGTDNGLGFNIEFDGMGRNVYTNTIFQHYHLANWSDSFSADNITNSNTTLNLPSRNPLSKSKLQFSTIVINPQYKNVTQLKLNIKESSVSLKPEQCETSALNFYEDFRDFDSPVERCCGTKCGKTDFQNNDGVFLSTLLGELKSSSNFKFDWEVDTAVPSEDSVNVCGGVLSGRVGKISYKVDEEYASNERCTWLIHPTGKSKVKMTLLNEELEDGYDLLVVTSIGNDFSIDSEPENTILQKSNSYNFTGPVIFVTFFSDSTAQGKGFELVWEDAGSNLHEGSSAMALPIYLSDETGVQMLSLDAPVYQVVVINPKYLDGSALHLTLTKLEAEFGSKCGSNGLKIFGSDNGNFSVAKWFCENNEGGFPAEDFQTVDGIFVLVYHSEQSVGNVEFTWKKGPSPKEAVLEGDLVVEQTEGCGGILMGDSGRIDYKLNTTYNNFERCTWVIQSARRSKITLRLLKDKFESCCDFIIASQLNPENGTLSKNYAQIDRENKFKSFTAPVLFVTFFSDSSVGDHGFSLEFTTSGDLIENPFKFRHQHLSQIQGSVSIPSENELLPLTNEILTFVFSPDAIPGAQQETNITVNVTNFGEDKQCQKDSLTLYEVPYLQKKVAISSKRITCSNSQLENDVSCGCVPGSSDVSENLKIVDNRAFIVIFKPVESTTAKSFNFQWITTAEAAYENSTTATES